MSFTDELADLRANIARLDAFVNGGAGETVALKTAQVATLLGMVGTSVGPNPPIITWPGRHWIDNTDPQRTKLMIRDAGNAAWIEIAIIPQIEWDAAQAALLLVTDGQLAGGALSDLTSDLVAGPGKLKLSFPFPIEILSAPLPLAWVSEAPSGASIIVDMNVAGISIMTTKMSIEAGGLISSDAIIPPDISDGIVPAFQPITFDIDQVGSITAGKGLNVLFAYRRTG